MNTTRVALCIYDYDGSFDEITEKMGIAPTELLESEERGGEKGVLSRRWELSSGESESAPLEQHLEKLTTKLSKSHTALKEIASQCKCSVSVGIYYRQFNPEIVLSSSTLAALADMGVELWLDTYYLEDETSQGV